MKANENYIEVNGKELADPDRTEMISGISTHFKDILTLLKFDVETDQQIVDTPRRWAKMMVNELCSGCYSPEPKITTFDNTNNYDQMVFLGPIELKSMCSHHFKSFIGNCYISYVADKKIVGISKLARIVKWFMRRPQIQEELTKQIADYLEKVLVPQGCAVYIEATHLCMVARGIEENQNAKMITSDLRGCLKNADAKQEFFSMIRK